MHSNTRLQSDALIHQSHDALIVRDLEDIIQFWSKGAERLYGWAAEEAIGRNLYELLIPQQVGPNLRQVTKSGAEVIVESLSANQLDEGGQCISVLIANKNITERARLETEILHAQRVESVCSLSSCLAHDLNNTLYLIQTSIGELLQEDIFETDSRKALESSKFQVEHAAQVISQLLSLGRRIEEENTSINIGQLIAEASRILATVFPENIDIRTTVEKGLWKVRGNATQLYQVVLNLCLNARDAMPNGGQLTIEAGNIELADPSGRYVNLRVTDTGTGIPCGIAASIFNAFFTTKTHGNGTGLGLYAVKSIVEKHSAVINFSTEPQRGTKFVVCWPAEAGMMNENFRYDE